MKIIRIFFAYDLHSKGEFAMNKHGLLFLITALVIALNISACHKPQDDGIFELDIQNNRDAANEIFLPDSQTKQDTEDEIFLPDSQTRQDIIKTSSDLMKGITANPVHTPQEYEFDNANLTDFSLRIFKECYNGNTLLSPLSVMLSLSMAANGAGGETLSQIETAFGGSIDDINNYLYSYKNSLYSTDECKVNIANSIWFKDCENFKANTDFLQKNADYYGADLYKSPFDDMTVDKINEWVNENTAGMIPKIVDKLNKEDVMKLINAISFEAKWEKEYRPYDTSEDTFFNENGSEVEKEFMKSVENVYIHDVTAKGFMKYYKGGRYAFAAILPNKETTLDKYLASLDGAKLQSLVENAVNKEVITYIPIFKSNSTFELAPTLKNMGINLAFDPDKADFSSLGTSDDGNICISNVTHKTYIEVDDQGTKAAASTETGAVISTSKDTRPRVCLDRPFLYMIIDTQTKTPIFIGTLTSMQ